jgi:hypothetical protein
VIIYIIELQVELTLLVQPGRNDKRTVLHMRGWVGVIFYQLMAFAACSRLSYTPEEHDLILSGQLREDMGTNKRVTQFIF